VEVEQRRLALLALDRRVDPAAGVAQKSRALVVAV